MANESVWYLHEEWRSDAWAFLYAVGNHWAAATLSILGGAAAIYLAAVGILIPAWIASGFTFISLLIGFFRAWRDERRAKEVALKPPPIDGTWVRNKYPAAPGVLKLELDGYKLSGTFKEGDIDHKLEGEYDPRTRQFNHTVERVHRADKSAQRFNQISTYWMVRDDLIYFETPLNANGEPESGFFTRPKNQLRIR